MTARVPQLKRAMPEAYVEIHPADARTIGVSTGDRVRVQETRPLSKNKRWRLVEILERAK